MVKVRNRIKDSIEDRILYIVVGIFFTIFTKIVL